MISDIVMALAFFRVRADRSLATSVVVKWCVKYYVLYYAELFERTCGSQYLACITPNAEVVIILGFALLSDAYLTYSAFVADCLWWGPSVHWIPNLFWCPMYRIEYNMMMTRWHNTSCVQDELCRASRTVYPIHIGRYNLDHDDLTGGLIQW